MANNFVGRLVDVTASYVALSANSEVVTVTLSAPLANAENVFIQGDTGDDVPVVPGEWHILKSVDLSRIKIKGTVNDTVTLIGGTW